jgi:hypothetical protein
MHGRHVTEDIHLAKVGEAGFEVVQSFPHVRAQQTCKF